MTLLPSICFNAVFSFVIAPGSILGTFFKTPATSHSDSFDSAVNTALSRILRGQEKKEIKMLCSNGVAKINPATVSTLKNLHPERKNSTYNRHSTADN